MIDISPEADTTLGGNHIHDHNQPSFLDPNLYDMPSVLPPSQPQTANEIPTDPPPPPLLEGMDIVNLLEDWLNHGEGHPSAENALTLLFADSSQPSEPSSLPYNQFISADPTGIDWPSSMNFTTHPPQEQRYTQSSSNDRHNISTNTLPRLATLPDSQLGVGVASAPLQAFIPSNPPSKPLVHPRAGLAADTWESGISQSRGPSTPRPDRAYPSRITSPEQVVVELQVDVEAEVSRLTL